MKTSANYLFSLLLIAIFLIYPSIIKADDTENSIKRNRISWALMPQFNLNTPGNWKSFKPYDKTNISYGGGIGCACRIQLKGNWLIDAGTSICYDNYHISASNVMPHAIGLERWTVPISTSIGHSFVISDEKDILPLAGIEVSYCFSNKISDSFDMPDFNCNRLNLSWGIGCGLRFYEKYEIDIIGYFGLLHMITQKDTELYDNKIRMSFKYFF